ncbi:MAG TPA: SPOR domain-containing protein [Burkholderiaceae bacterium]|nr:SPOR domain-containing protein [Burkholderiaceae bacterium]
MLRLLVLLLLLANGAYYAWSQRLLVSWGLGPVQQAEPQRLAQQLRPEAVRILSAEEDRRSAAAASVAAAKGPECLQAGNFDDSQGVALGEALSKAALPAGSWSVESVVQPARWIVYMGKYADVEMLAKKKAELRQRNVSFETLANPALEPGLSLGGFETQAEAARQLDVLSERGVRTARVMQERPEVRTKRLVLPAVDDALRPRLEEIKPLLSGKALRACI